MILNADKMKTILSFILSVFCLLSLSAQNTVVVRNSENNQPIPFAHLQIKYSKKVLASNQSGVVYLSGIKTGQDLVVSSLGFKTITVSYSPKLKVIQLEPQAFGLKEVIVKPEKRKEQIVGEHRRKSNRSFTLGEIGKELKIARYFNFIEKYNETPFIKQLNVMTRSDIWRSEFEVNFFDLDSILCPSKPILEEWILVKTRLGKTKNRIKLDTIFPFPQEGLYVVVRLINKESNRHDYKYTMSDSRKKYKGVTFEPSLCLVPVEDGEYYTKLGSRKYWRQALQWNRNDYGLEESNYYKGKDVVPAIELILSN